MSKGEAPLICVLTLLLQLNLAAPAALAARCPVYSTYGYPVCNESCSKPSRIEFGDGFPCKLGFKKEWLSFKETYRLDRATTISVANSSFSKQYQPLQLSELAMHPVKYKKKTQFSPALNVTFDILFNYGPLRLKAVLLTFGSPTFKKPSDAFLTDKDYTIQKDQDLRIYRLFNFSSYIPSTYEIQHPIRLSYPCLYGLDECEGHNGKVYTITLTSITMNVLESLPDYFRCQRTTCVLSSITYTISTVPVRYKTWNHDQTRAYNDKYLHWNATIATAIYPTSKDIYVVFERLEGFNRHTVYLLQNDGTVRKKVLTSSWNYIFKELPFGRYGIEVEYCDKSDSCKKYKAFQEIIIEFGDKTSNPFKLPVIFAVISGATIAVFLLLLLAWFRCKKGKRLSGECEQSTCETSERYTILSNNDESSLLLANLLHLNILPRLGIESDNIHHRTSGEHIPSTSQVFCLLPVEHKTFRVRISNDNFYKQTIEQLVTRGENKILIIYFPFLKGARRVPWSVLRKLKRVCLGKDFCKFAKILNKERTFKANLIDIRSDLESTLRRTKEMLRSKPQTYVQEPKLEIVEETYTGSDSCDEIIIDEDCPIHGHSICPFHDRSRHDTDRHPVRFSNYPNQRHLNNELKNDRCQQAENTPLLPDTSHQNLPISDISTIHRYHDNIPLQDIIPPSPVISEKYFVSKKEDRNASNSSGYTSQIQTSENNDNDLADDDSIIDQILKINQEHLPGENGAISNDVDDLIFNLNF